LACSLASSLRKIVVRRKSRYFVVEYDEIPEAVLEFLDADRR
jgi:hypothetical protein